MINTTQQTERGDGTTTKQIMALKDGDIFVIASYSEANHTIRLMQKHRQRAFPIIALGQGMNHLERLRGSTYRAVVDHHAAEVLTDQQRAFIEAHTERYP